MKKYTVELTEEQLKQLGIKVEPEYPLFKRWKPSGEIVKFTSMSGGVTVWEGNRGKHNKIGHIESNLVNPTNSIWEDVAYDPERDLWDKQPVECWDNEDIHSRLIGFYDAKNESVFTYKGYRGGLAFDNYKPLPSDRYDEWILDVYKTLEK